MTDGLVGCTGFVGRQLAAARAFDVAVSSTTVDAICGLHFDTLVCAGVRAVKWQANLHPDEDWLGIERLLERLSQTSAERFVLVSTVDVYPSPRGVDEESVVDPEENHAYGRHRYLLETRVRELFPRALVVRLPALFGPGLSKNALFDLLEDRRSQPVNAASSYQWYDLAWLARDLELASAAGLETVNLAVEPLLTRELVASFFPDRVVDDDEARAVHYDMRSRFATELGGAGDYLRSAPAVKDALGRFVRDWRRP